MTSSQKKIANGRGLVSEKQQTHNLSGIILDSKSKMLLETIIGNKNTRERETERQRLSSERKRREATSREATWMLPRTVPV